MTQEELRVKFGAPEGDVSPKFLGRRINPYPTSKDPFVPPQPGDYGKDADGVWHCCAPRDTGDWFTNFHGNLGNGENHHKVVEHENGEITVSPSILITGHDGSWHGFLRNGVWSEC